MILVSVECVLLFEDTFYRPWGIFIAALRFIFASYVRGHNQPFQWMTRLGNCVEGDAMIDDRVLML